MDDEFDFDEIRKKIESIYRKGAELAEEHQPPPNLDTPPEVRAELLEYVLQDGELRDLIQYARNYMLAANKLGDPFADGNFAMLLPKLQLTGHAIELALKACIQSRTGTFPHGHNLTELYRTAHAVGIRLSRRDFAYIVHLGHFYSEDLVTGTRHLARYPAKGEGASGSIPPAESFTAIVNCLLDQVSPPSPPSIQ